MDADDNLIAIQWTYVFPEGDAIADGDSNDFEMTFWLDPAVDPNSLTISYMVQGDVK